MTISYQPIGLNGTGVSLNIERNGLIVPLEAGGEIAPFLSASRTSYVAKTHKPIGIHSIFVISKSHVYFLRSIDFGKCSCYDDQLIRSTQSVGDGFYASKPGRTVMVVLLNLSAYQETTTTRVNWTLSLSLIHTHTHTLSLSLSLSLFLSLILFYIAKKNGIRHNPQKIYSLLADDFRKEPANNRNKKTKTWFFAREK